MASKAYFVNLVATLGDLNYCIHESGRIRHRVEQQVLDTFNPMLAARLVQAFARWRRFEPGRQALMRAQLERLAATPKLSKDLYEVVSKALA